MKSGVTARPSSTLTLHGPVVRRVEGDLHVDVALGSEDVHPLVAHVLRPDDERRLSAAEVENGRRETIAAALGVALADARHPPRLRGEDEPGDVDGVAPDVEEGAAARILLVTDVGDVAVVVREGHLHGAHLADAPAADQVDDLVPLRVVTDHEGLRDDLAGLPLHLGQLLGLRGGHRDGFFAKDVLARPGRLDRPGHVQVVGQRVVDGFDLGIGQQFFVAAVRPRHADRRGRLSRLGERPRGERAKLDQRRLPRRGDGRHEGEVAGAEHAPANGRDARGLLVVHGRHRKGN